MIDYQIAHTLQELRKWAKEGYEFVAIITPNDWMVGKPEVIPVAQKSPVDEPIAEEDIKDAKDVKIPKSAGGPKTIKSK